MKSTELYWEDSNGNKWMKSTHTRKQAEENSSTLINCRDCWDCWDCRDCHGCRDCRDCWDCQDCQDCRGCWDCRDCRDCLNCHGCRGCLNCRDYKLNPMRYTGVVMGSRYSQTTTYWLDGKVQVVCGCFRGSLDEFASKVESTHEDNDHGKAYRQYIAVVRTIMQMEETK